MLAIPLRKGPGLAPGRGKAAKSRTLRIWVSTSAVLTSSGKGQLGKVDPGYA
jgi:hypothetical protein